MYFNSGLFKQLRHVLTILKAHQLMLFLQQWEHFPSPHTMPWDYRHEFQICRQSCTNSQAPRALQQARTKFTFSLLSKEGPYQKQQWVHLQRETRRAVTWPRGLEQNSHSPTEVSRKRVLLVVIEHVDGPRPQPQIITEAKSYRHLSCDTGLYVTPSSVGMS